MKPYPLYILFAAVPGIVLAQEAPSVVSTAANAAGQSKTRAQGKFMVTIDTKYKDRMAIDIILKNQWFKTVEQMRQIMLAPDVADNAKRYNLPNLKASYQIFQKGQKSPLPQDLQEYSKKAVTALRQIINIEEERAARRAKLPEGTQDDNRIVNAEESKLMDVRSEYETNLKALESMRLEKYGVDVQQYNKVIVPIINNAVRKVNAQTPPAERAAALNQLFDELLEKW